MKWLTLLFAGCLVLAVSSPARAFLLSGWTPGDSISIHFNSLDVGNVYQYGLFLGVPACNAATIAGPAGGMPPFPAANAEDAWGIARVSNITDGDNTETYWSAATANTEITALFFGIVDQSVKNTQLTPNLDQHVSFASGFKFMMFEDTAKNYNPNAGPSARAGIMSYPTVTDGTLVLEAAGVLGLFDTLQGSFLNPVYADHSSSTDLVWDPTHTFYIQVQNSSGHAYADIADLNGDGIATGADLAGSNHVPTANPLVNADIKLDWTLTPPGNPVVLPWWDLADQDPAQMYPFPEPATLALLGVGGGLAVLLRRRRR